MIKPLLNIIRIQIVKIKETKVVYFQMQISGCEIFLFLAFKLCLKFMIIFQINKLINPLA
jgi:hypothetical protein